jgi:hypothetical protein
MKNDKKKYPVRACVSAVFTALLLSGCEVTNPGPVQDGAGDASFLYESDTWITLVRGSGRSLADAIDRNAYTQGAVTREIHPGGETSNYGITNFQQLGWLKWNDEHINFGDLAEARWTAEDAIRRMLGQEPYNNPPPTDAPDSDVLAQAYLYAGYANRLLGETQCVAVIDGSAAQASTVYLDRALTHFQNALANAEANSNRWKAANAGLASIYVDLGDWDNAVAHSVLITDDSWRYQMPYYADFGEGQHNYLAWARSTTPYKAYTFWNTVYGDTATGQATGTIRGSYFLWEPNDPRVAWQKLYSDTDVWVQGGGALGCCGRVPFWPPDKYAEVDAPIDLSTGHEMRLIEAEKALRDGNTSAAIDILNSLRLLATVESEGSAAPADTLEMWDNTVTADSAWSMLKRERGIELHLEARRMHDMRRWNADGTVGGSYDVLEIPAPGAAGPEYMPSHLRQQDLCFPLDNSEEETNTNICMDTDGNIIACS